MAAHGIHFSEERFYALGGMPSNKIVALLAEENDLKLDVQAVADEKEDAFLEMLHLLTPVDVILQVARENRGIKPMAVASGGFRRIIERQLDQIGCRDWFDTIVTAEDTLHHKPAPDCFLEAARRMNVPPERCCVFEDADLGVEAAQRAKMHWIDVRVLSTES